MSMIKLKRDLEIQLSRGEGWDFINRFTPATCFCRSEARTWIFNCHISGSFFFSCNDL